MTKKGRILTSIVSVIIAMTSVVDKERGNAFMEGLAEVKRKTGKPVHYVHVSGQSNYPF